MQNNKNNLITSTKSLKHNQKKIKGKKIYILRLYLKSENPDKFVLLAELVR